MGRLSSSQGFQPLRWLWLWSSCHPHWSLPPFSTWFPPPAPPRCLAVLPLPCRLMRPPLCLTPPCLAPSFLAPCLVPHPPCLAPPCLAPPCLLSPSSLPHLPLASSFLLLCQPCPFYLLPHVNPLALALHPTPVLMCSPSSPPVCRYGSSLRWCGCYGRC